MYFTDYSCVLLVQIWTLLEFTYTFVYVPLGVAKLIPSTGCQRVELVGLDWTDSEKRGITPFARSNWNLKAIIPPITWLKLQVIGTSKFILFFHVALNNWYSQWSSIIMLLKEGSVHFQIQNPLPERVDPQSVDPQSVTSTIPHPKSVARESSQSVDPNAV